uniref:Uncharacterized protein n=1 Tax=Trachysalambria curvirostris majanivirus TaxID=2984281 RepID=A0A9C7BWL8_9VIRU|nr:MAG: hypothetical protein [Trachysalambria curvirostris majanivirus]
MSKGKKRNFVNDIAKKIVNKYKRNQNVQTVYFNNKNRGDYKIKIDGNKNKEERMESSPVRTSGLDENYDSENIDLDKSKICNLQEEAPNIKKQISNNRPITNEEENDDNKQNSTVKNESNTSKENGLLIDKIDTVIKNVVEKSDNRQYIKGSSRKRRTSKENGLLIDKIDTVIKNVVEKSDNRQYIKGSSRKRRSELNDEEESEIKRRKTLNDISQNDKISSNGIVDISNRVDINNDGDKNDNKYNTTRNQELNITKQQEPNSRVSTDDNDGDKNDNKYNTTINQELNITKQQEPNSRVSTDDNDGDKNDNKYNTTRNQELMATDEQEPNSRVSTDDNDGDKNDNKYNTTRNQELNITKQQEPNSRVSTDDNDGDKNDNKYNTTRNQELNITKQQEPNSRVSTDDNDGDKNDNKYNTTRNQELMATDEQEPNSRAYIDNNDDIVMKDEEKLHNNGLDIYDKTCDRKDLQKERKLKPNDKDKIYNKLKKPCLPTRKKILLTMQKKLNDTKIKGKQKTKNKIKKKTSKGVSQLDRMKRKKEMRRGIKINTSSKDDNKDPIKKVKTTKLNDIPTNGTKKTVQLHKKKKEKGKRRNIDINTDKVNIRKLNIIEIDENKDSDTTTGNSKETYNNNDSNKYKLYYDNINNTEHYIKEETAIYKSFITHSKLNSFYFDNGVKMERNNGLYTSNIDDYEKVHLNPGLICYNIDRLSFNIIEEISNALNITAVIPAFLGYIFNQVTDDCGFQEKGCIKIYNDNLIPNHPNNYITKIEIICNSFIWRSVLLFYCILTYDKNYDIEDVSIKRLYTNNPNYLYTAGIKLVEEIKKIIHISNNDDKDSHYSYLCICILNQLYQEVCNAKNENDMTIRDTIFTRDYENNIIIRAKDSFNSNLTCLHSLLYNPNLLFVKSVDDVAFLFVYSVGAANHFIAIIIWYTKYEKKVKLEKIKIGIFNTHIGDNKNNAPSTMVTSTKQIIKDINVNLVGLSEVQDYHTFKINQQHISINYNDLLKILSFNNIQCFSPLINQIVIDTDIVTANIDKQFPFQYITENVYKCSKVICNKILSETKFINIATGNGIDNLYQSHQIFQKIITIKGIRSIQSGLIPIISKDKITGYFLISGTLHSRLKDDIFPGYATFNRAFNPIPKNMDSFLLSCFTIDPTVDEAWCYTKTVVTYIKDMVINLIINNLINNENDMIMLAKKVDNNALSFDDVFTYENLSSNFRYHQFKEVLSFYKESINDKPLKQKLDYILKDDKTFNIEKQIEIIIDKLFSIFRKNNCIENNMKIIGETFLSLCSLIDFRNDDMDNTFRVEGEDRLDNVNECLSTPQDNKYNILNRFREYLHSYFLQLWCCLENFLVEYNVLNILDFNVVSFVIFLYASSLTELFTIYSSQKLFNRYYQWGYGLFDMTCKASCLISNHLRDLVALSNRNLTYNLGKSYILLDEISSALGAFPYFMQDSYFGEDQFKYKQEFKKHILEFNHRTEINKPLHEKSNDSIFQLFHIENNNNNTLNTDYINVWKGKQYNRQIEEQIQFGSSNIVYNENENTYINLSKNPWDIRREHIEYKQNVWGKKIIDDIKAAYNQYHASTITNICNTNNDGVINMGETPCNSELKNISENKELRENEKYKTFAMPDESLDEMDPIMLHLKNEKHINGTYENYINDPTWNEVINKIKNLSIYVNHIDKTSEFMTKIIDIVDILLKVKWPNSSETLLKTIEISSTLLSNLKSDADILPSKNKKLVLISVDEIMGTLNFIYKKWNSGINSCKTNDIFQLDDIHRQEYLNEFISRCSSKCMEIDQYVSNKAIVLNANSIEMSNISESDDRMHENEKSYALEIDRISNIKKHRQNRRSAIIKDRQMTKNAGKRHKPLNITKTKYPNVSKIENIDGKDNTKNINIIPISPNLPNNSTVVNDSRIEDNTFPPTTLVDSSKNTNGDIKIYIRSLSDGIEIVDDLISKHITEINNMRQNYIFQINSLYTCCNPEILKELEPSIKTLYSKCNDVIKDLEKMREDNEQNRESLNKAKELNTYQSPDTVDLNIVKHRVELVRSNIPTYTQTAIREINEIYHILQAKHNQYEQGYKNENYNEKPIDMVNIQNLNENHFHNNGVNTSPNITEPKVDMNGAYNFNRREDENPQNVLNPSQILPQESPATLSYKNSDQNNVNRYTNNEIPISSQSQIMHRSLRYIKRGRRKSKLQNRQNINQQTRINQVPLQSTSHYDHNNDNIKNTANNHYNKSIYTSNPSPLYQYQSPSLPVTNTINSTEQPNLQKTLTTPNNTTEECNEMEWEMTNNSPVNNYLHSSRCNKEKIQEHVHDLNKMVTNKDPHTSSTMISVQPPINFNDKKDEKKTSYETPHTYTSNPSTLYQYQSPSLPVTNTINSTEQPNLQKTLTTPKNTTEESNEMEWDMTKNYPVNNYLQSNRCNKEKIEKHVHNLNKMVTNKDPHTSSTMILVKNPIDFNDKRDEKKPSYETPHMYCNHRDGLDMNMTNDYLKGLYFKHTIYYHHPLYYTHLFTIKSEQTHLSRIDKGTIREKNTRELIVDIESSLCLLTKENEFLLTNETVVNDIALNLYFSLRRCLIEINFKDPGALSIINNVLLMKNSKCNDKYSKDTTPHIRYSSTPDFINSLIFNCIYHDTILVSNIATIVLSTYDTLIKNKNDINNIFNTIVIGLMTSLDILRDRSLISQSKCGIHAVEESIDLANRIIGLIFGFLPYKTPTKSVWRKYKICYQMPFIFIIIECINNLLLVIINRIKHLREALINNDLLKRSIPCLGCIIISKKDNYNFHSLDYLLLGMIDVVRNVKQSFKVIFYNIFLYLCSLSGNNNFDIGDDQQYSILDINITDILPKIMTLYPFTGINNQKNEEDGSIFINVSLKHMANSDRLNIPQVFLENSEFRLSLKLNEEIIDNDNINNNLHINDGNVKNIYLGVRCLYVTKPPSSPNTGRLQITNLALLPEYPIPGVFNNKDIINLVLSKVPPTKADKDELPKDTYLTTFSNKPIIKNKEIAKNVFLTIKNIGGISSIEKLIKVRDKTMNILKTPQDVLVYGGSMSIPLQYEQNIKNNSHNYNQPIKWDKNFQINSRVASPSTILSGKPNNKIKHNVKSTDILVPSILNPLLIKQDLENTLGEYNDNKRYFKQIPRSCGALYMFY